MYAQVMVDIAHSAVDRLYTYVVPEGLTPEPGHHVLVPFGRQDKPTEGFVLALTEKKPDYPTLKSLYRIIEPYPILLPDQIELAYWMQKNYHCVLVDALRLMIPAQLRGGRVREKTVRTLRLADGVDLQQVQAAMRSKNGRCKAPAQWAVLELFANGAELPASEVTKLVPGSASALRALVDKGILTEQQRVQLRTPMLLGGGASQPAVTLTPHQQAAVDAIRETAAAGGGVCLLHGVTGSGKTEVYIRCIQNCIRQEKQAIVLVPEISLTPQTVSRFRQRFGDAVAVLHSRLSAGERFDEWRRIRLGQVQVVVGARSAVFAPLPRLGLVILDEEHEQSYQSESIPRYHALDVAKKRCTLCGGTLVLGSATPSLTTYTRAQLGQYRLVSLPERVQKRPLPKVDVVDMREEFLGGNSGLFSGLLLQCLKECLENGKQAILFLNRRGYATFVSCRGCGYVVKCPACDVSMAYHKTERTLKCHYCGRTQRLPAVCPACGKPYIKQFGVGTQQVEEQLELFFPGVRSIRMDTDTTQAKGAHEKLLAAFARGEAQVLIGTQMIAKGLDFPNVTLVGVVAADTTLNIPDFRSAERTFQLLTQVAGRAGRDVDPGRVVIQTYHPQKPSIRFAKEHDYVGFARQEMLQRRTGLYPPYSLFVRILFTGEKEPELCRAGEDFAKELENRVREVLGKEHEVELLLLRASLAPIRWKQGRYRYQVLLKLLRTARTRQVLRTVFDYTAQQEQTDLPKGVVEVNPADLF